MLELVAGPQKGIAALEETAGRINSDLLLLLTFSKAISTRHLAELMIQSAPQQGEQLTADRHEIATQFLQRLSWSGIGGDRFISIRHSIENATTEVERELRSDSAAPPPSGVSPHDWREWLISDRQCRAVVKALRRIKAEIEEGLAREYRPHLQGAFERMNLKKKS
jgi:hypothetical protein